MKRPPYENFPVISNERLSLREIHSDDMKDLIEISFYDVVKMEKMSRANYAFFSNPENSSLTFSNFNVLR
jgi:hypothetical protein